MCVKFNPLKNILHKNNTPMIYKRSQKPVHHSLMLKNQSRIAQPSLETLKETDSLLSPKKSIASIPNKAERESIKRSLFQQSAETSSEQVVQRATTQSSNSYNLVDELNSNDRTPYIGLNANDRATVDEYFEEFHDSNNRDPHDELNSNNHAPHNELNSNGHDPYIGLDANDRAPVDEYFEEFYDSNNRDSHDELNSNDRDPHIGLDENDRALVDEYFEEFYNPNSQHSQPEKKTGWVKKVANSIFVKRHNIAAQNTLASITTSVAQGGASGTLFVGEHSGVLTHTGNLISGTVGGAVGAPVSALGAIRSGRQALRADQRSQIAQNYADKLEAESSDEDGKKLAAILKYVAQKQGTRAKKLGGGASLAAASATAGVGALATGLVTPPGVVLGTASAVLGGASAITSVAPMGKALYKQFKGTKGKNRKANATELYELAKKGHEPSLQFLQEPKVGVLKEGPRPHIDAKGFYVEDLQDESKRKFIIKYITQKMRS
ncbi:hypothetical protein AB0758_24345 [Tolypothrix bouteillei VB521301_2]